MVHVLPIEEQNIIRLLGIEDLPDERKIELVEKMTDLLEKRLLLRVFEALDADKQDMLRGLLDKEDAPELSGFLETNVPELAEWAMEEVGKLKKDLAGLVK